MADREGRVTAAEALESWRWLLDYYGKIGRPMRSRNVSGYLEQQAEQEAAEKVIHEGWALVEDGDETFDGQPDVTCFRSKPDEKFLSGRVTRVRVVEIEGEET